MSVLAKTPVVGIAPCGPHQHTRTSADPPTVDVCTGAAAVQESPPMMGAHQGSENQLGLELGLDTCPVQSGRHRHTEIHASRPAGHPGAETGFCATRSRWLPAQGSAWFEVDPQCGICPQSCLACSICRWWPQSPHSGPPTRRPAQCWRRSLRARQVRALLCSVMFMTTNPRRL